MLIKNLTYLVNQNNKKPVIFIFFLILIGMIVETLSIGLIIPVIALVTNENFFENYSSIVTVISNFSPLNFFVVINATFPSQLSPEYCLIYKYYFSSRLFTNTKIKNRS